MLKSDKCVQEETVRVNANDTVMQGVCFTILAKNQIFLNEVNETRLENKTPRKIMNMD